MKTITKTATQKLDEFYQTAGSDVSKYSDEQKKEHLNLAQAAQKEANAVDPKEKAEYEALCAEHKITVSDKFRGWISEERKGKKDEKGEAKVTQLVEGLTYRGEAGILFHIRGHISPKKDVEALKKAVRVEAIRALGAR